MNTPLPYQNKNRLHKHRTGGRPMWKSMPFGLGILFAFGSCKSYFGDEIIKLTLIGSHDLRIYWGGPDRLSLAFSPSDSRDMSVFGWSHFPRDGGDVSMTQFQCLGATAWSLPGSFGLGVPLSSTAVLFFALAWFRREKRHVVASGPAETGHRSDAPRRWASVLIAYACCLIVLTLWSSRQAISVPLPFHSKLVVQADSLCVLPLLPHSQPNTISVTDIDWQKQGTIYFGCKPVYFSFCGLFAGALNDWRGSVSVYVVPISLVAAMSTGWAVWLQRLSSSRSGANAGRADF